MGDHRRRLGDRRPASRCAVARPAALIFLAGRRPRVVDRTTASVGGDGDRGRRPAGLLILGPVVAIAAGLGVAVADGWRPRALVPVVPWPARFVRALRQRGHGRRPPACRPVSPARPSNRAGGLRRSGHPALTSARRQRSSRPGCRLRGGGHRRGGRPYVALPAGALPAGLPVLCSSHPSAGDRHACLPLHPLPDSTWLRPATPLALGVVLGIGAHPDDEAYLSAGLMALARRAGNRVVCVTMTPGEHGTDDPAGSLRTGATTRPS